MQFVRLLQSDHRILYPLGAVRGGFEAHWLDVCDMRWNGRAQGRSYRNSMDCGRTVRACLRATRSNISNKKCVQINKFLRLWRLWRLWRL